MNFQSPSKLYIGFRIEVASRIIPSNLDAYIQDYNKLHNCNINNIYLDGRVVADKINGMVVAKGIENKHKIKVGHTVNFGMIAPMNEIKEIERLIQIINVLGNGKLIRERVKSFLDDKSILSKIPELEIFKADFQALDKYLPGFVMNAWYYAPETIW